jgi:hypothetical protein
MKLVKALQASLQQLDAAGSSWTIEMDEQRRQDVLKLEKLGLVKLRPCYTGQRARGQCRGRLNGYDVSVTPSGKDLLR